MYPDVLFYVADNIIDLFQEMASHGSSSRFQVLCYDQVIRLHHVMEDVMPIHGRGNFPTLGVKLRDMVQAVRDKLFQDGVKVRDVRLNGSGASYILARGDTCQDFNDLDLIFGIDLLDHGELQKIRKCVIECLLDFLPDGVSKDKISSCSLKEAYVQKMVKVCNEHGDKWSLISLSNKTHKNVELKFVGQMKRQFEFSVDSFQVILDSLLTFYAISQTPMSDNFYPTVVAESLYGNFNEAWFHLDRKLIATRNPEEIRGGGLLKYCNLLVKDYLPAEDIDIHTMERYMCSRFFIDFSDINQQRQKLQAYLANHFGTDERIKYQYLTTLYQVVDESTICLMGYERRQTLNLIHQLAYQVLMIQERKTQVKCIALHELDQLNNLVIDQVFYGPFSGTSANTQLFTYAVPSSLFGHRMANSPPCPYCPQSLRRS